MKSVTELGLETIQLEDQVLLVDQDLSRGGDTKYYLNGFIGRLYSNPQYQSYDILDFDGSLLERVRIKSDEIPYRIIASTKPLEGIPLLVIEDEAMLNALNVIEEGKIENKSTQIIFIGSYTTGYNKAKETYKFTEEDIREAICEAWNSCEDNEDEETFTQVFNRIIQSLTKKELWVETEEKIALDGHTIIGTELKITNNQIKGVWK